MTTEEIKRTWAEAARRFYAPEPEELETMYRRKKETALERLAARYRRFSRFGLAMAVVSLCWLMPSHGLVEGNMKYVVAIVFMLYFVTCSLIDDWLYRGVASIDCYTMSVSEVVEKALYYRKKHLQSMAVLIPFAILVVGLLAYSFNSEPYMLYGMVAGLIVGIAIGTMQLRRFMDEYRTISNS